MIDSDASREDSRSIKERFQHNNVEQAGLKDMGLDKIGSQKESGLSCTTGWRLKIEYNRSATTWKMRRWIRPKLPRLGGGKMRLDRFVVSAPGRPHLVELLQDAKYREF